MPSSFNMAMMKWPLGDDSLFLSKFCYSSDLNVTIHLKPLQQNFKRFFSMLYTGYRVLGVLFDQSLAMIYLSLCNKVNVARAVIGRWP